MTEFEALESEIEALQAQLRDKEAEVERKRQEAQLLRQSHEEKQTYIASRIKEAEEAAKILKEEGSRMTREQIESYFDNLLT